MIGHKQLNNNIVQSNDDYIDDSTEKLIKKALSKHIRKYLEGGGYFQVKKQYNKLLYD